MEVEVLPREGYFLLGQFMTEQFAQFSSSSFSRPKGIVSPHRQSQPEEILVCNTCSQKGQVSISAPPIGSMVRREGGFPL